MGEIGEAQDRISERDPDGAETDHGTRHEPVDQERRAHDGTPARLDIAASCRAAPR